MLNTILSWNHIIDSILLTSGKFYYYMMKHQRCMNKQFGLLLLTHGILG